MNAADIAAALGDAFRVGRGWRCRCPVHGGRSLTLRDGDDGRLLVTCWGGCNRLDVLAELRRSGLLNAGATNNYRPISAAPDKHSDGQIARAVAIWREARPAAGTPVEKYLASRSITGLLPSKLRFHPACRHPNGARLPAMVALVEHATRGAVAVHRTYLQIDGFGKVLASPPKASLGPVGGGAVRLGRPRAGEWLAVAEGIETALAVAVACAMPAWAALSAGGVRTVILPPEATHIVMCADHDASGTGERAARAAAARWVTEGRRVRIAMPPAPDTDMADVLAGQSPAAIKEARGVAR
jgi:putative DNA primase/helicase